MFKPFCYKMINNNIRAESKLATSAATFLKWEEVYIFCFLQSETLELGDPCISFLSPALSYVFVLWRWAHRQGFAFHCNLTSRGESICSCNNLLFPPVYAPSIHLSIPVSSQCLVFLRCLSFPALFPLPSELKGLSQMSCLSPFSPSLLPNLGWKLCCTHLLFRSSLDTCSVNVFVFETVHIQKGKRKKSTNICWRWNFLLLCQGKEAFGDRWQHLHD